jgi:putative hemolysin
VQIRISLIGVLSGAFGGATLVEPLAGALANAALPLAPYAGAIALGAVVAGITYLSLIVGELVPKRLALNAPEAVVSRAARPMRLLSSLTAPLVWLLAASTEAALRLLGVRRSEERRTEISAGPRFVAFVASRSAAPSSLCAEVHCTLQLTAEG